MSKQSLLLVDGDTRSLRVLEVSLRKAGFMVTAALSVQDALDKLELNAPDLIISETTFPAGDGFELRRRVRATPEWSEIPFIFLTAEAAIENKIRGLELGVDDYLTKPIYIKEIVTRINILLQKRQRVRFEERRDGRTRFAGRVQDMPVVDVIQTIEISRKSGVIQFVGERGRQAAIYFRDGRVIDAEAGALQGEDAVYRLLTWSEGEFEVVFRTVRRREVITVSSQGLLMEGMRRLDEWSRLFEQLPPLTHRFEVDTIELAARLGDVPDDNNRILRLFDGKRTLLEVIDASDVGDLECLQAISRLYFEELLLDLDHGKTPRRDTGKSLPLVEVEAPSAIDEVSSGPVAFEPSTPAPSIEVSHSDAPAEAEGEAGTEVAPAGTAAAGGAAGTAAAGGAAGTAAAGGAAGTAAAGGAAGTVAGGAAGVAASAAGAASAGASVAGVAASAGASVAGVAASAGAPGGAPAGTSSAGGMAAGTGTAAGMVAGGAPAPAGTSSAGGMAAGTGTVAGMVAGGMAAAGEEVSDEEAPDEARADAGDAESDEARDETSEGERDEAGEAAGELYDEDVGPLMGGYRPSSLRLIDEAVAAAQAIEPSLFDDSIDTAVRQGSGTLDTRDEPHAGNGVAAATMSAAVDSDATPPNLPAAPAMQMTATPLSAADREESGLRMIGSLGRDRAEASGELAPAGQRRPLRSETARELVTILPRRITRELPVITQELAESLPKPTPTSPVLAPRPVIAQAVESPAPALPLPRVSLPGSGVRTASRSRRLLRIARAVDGSGPGLGALLLIILAAVLAGTAVLLRLRRHGNPAQHAELIQDAGVPAAPAAPLGTWTAAPDAMAAPDDAARPRAHAGPAAHDGGMPADAHVVESGARVVEAGAPAVDAGVPAPQDAAAPNTGGGATARPDGPDKNAEAKTLYDKALAALDDNNFARALELAEASLRMRKTARTYLLRAQAEQRLDRVDAALASVDAAAQLAPEFGTVWETRGRILWAARRREEARGAFERFLKLEPDSPKAASVRRLMNEPR